MLAHFWFSFEMAAKKVPSIFLTEARCRDQLVKFQVEMFESQVKSISRKNDNAVETEQRIARVEITQH